MAKKKTEDETKTGMIFNEKTIKILSNFASINPSLLIYGNKLSVINDSNSVIGEYEFETPYSFDSFGLYDSPEFIQCMNSLEMPTFEVMDKYVEIKGKNDKLRYFTTAKELIKKAPNVSEKFDKLDCELQFSISADKLALLNKMASILKSTYLFFQSENDGIRITASNELETSANSYDIFVSENITSNKLDASVKIVFSEFKILPGDYNIKLSTKISKWENTNGVVYYVGVAA